MHMHRRGIWIFGTIAIGVATFLGIAATLGKPAAPFAFLKDHKPEVLNPNNPQERRFALRGTTIYSLRVDSKDLEQVMRKELEPLGYRIVSHPTWFVVDFAKGDWDARTWTASEHAVFLWKNAKWDPSYGLDQSRPGWSCVRVARRKGFFDRLRSMLGL
jgi:hypothetical protein